MPYETIYATFPPSMKICDGGKFDNLRLRPITIGDAVILAACGCDMGAEFDEPHALVAAWILTRPLEDAISTMLDMGAIVEETQRWMRSVAEVVPLVAKAVNGHIAATLSLFVPPAREKKRASFTLTGYGWPLEMAEAVCAEYGWTVADALKTPLATAFAFMAAANQRHGGKAGGPDYYERQFVKAIADAKTKAKSGTGAKR